MLRGSLLFVCAEESPRTSQVQLRQPPIASPGELRGTSNSVRGEIFSHIGFGVQWNPLPPEIRTLGCSHESQ